MIKKCKCGEDIRDHPLAPGVFAERCVVCTMLMNFHPLSCTIYNHRDAECSCGADKRLAEIAKDMEAKKRANMP